MAYLSSISCIRRLGADEVDVLFRLRELKLATSVICPTQFGIMATPEAPDPTSKGAEHCGRRGLSNCNILVGL